MPTGTLTGQRLVAARLEKLKGDGIGAILARGVAAGFLVNIAGAFLAFFVQAVLARIMGGQQYGIYIYAFTWLSFLGLLGKIGMDTTLLRYVAAYQARKEWSLLRGVLLRANQVALIVSLVTSLATALVVARYYDQLGRDLAVTFWILCIILPISSLSAMRQAALRGLRAVVLARLPDEVLRPGALAILAGAAYFIFSYEVTAIMAMSLQSVAILIAFVFGAFWLKRELPKEVWAHKGEYRTNEWVRFAVPLVMFSAMNIILHKIDTIMLGMFVDTTSAGYYSVASRIAKLMAFGLTAVNMIAAPMISSLHAENKREELQQMLTFAARGLVVYTLPISIITILFGDYLLLIFGEEFTAAYAALIILTIGQMINALAGSSGYVMTMTGHQNIALRIMFISAMANILLNWFMIPKYGVEGAAAATAITLIGWNLAFVIYARVKLGLKTTIL